MNKINILDSSIFNRIAAGEVVEKPASVLKELLDNSLDANASQIEIRVLDGGIKQIEVSDNGTGIEFDDLERVFLPHATSKIKTVDDLSKIGTLGFRGEALASIGAVSEVKVVSKTLDSEFGGEISISGGKVSKKEQVGAKNGTTITVNNIFYNVPARAKFLKKPKQEASEITNLVLRYILANPFVKIKYFLDETEMYSSTGNGLFEAIYCVYGKETTEKILKIDYKNNGIEVSGYISMPTFTKPNRTYQTLMVNGRYVQNAMVSMCVYNAFEHYLMKGQFPFYVVNINLPLDSVDVNVHPNKMDIRFENSNHIYGIVYQAVMNALNEHSRNVVEVNKKVFEYENKNASGISFSENAPKSIEQFNLEQNKEQNTDKKIEKVEIKTKPTIDFYESLSKNIEKPHFEQSNMILSNVFERVSDEKQNENIMQKQDNLLSVQEMENEIKNIVSSFLPKSYKYIGTLFDTFLIVQDGENAYMIDQHAAHERLLFDKFSKQVNDKELSIQSLLVPYTISVNSLEKQFLDENLENLKNLGFEICEFGNLTYKVETVPSLLYGINVKNFFDSVLSEISVFKQLKKSDLILERLMQHSCKNAVKAGDKLSESEVESLINEIEQKDMQLQCPHGRPVVVKLTKKEIEKWFKRIV